MGLQMLVRHEFGFCVGLTTSLMLWKRVVIRLSMFLIVCACFPIFSIFLKNPVARGESVTSFGTLYGKIYACRRGTNVDLTFLPEVGNTLLQIFQ